MDTRTLPQVAMDFAFRAHAGQTYGLDLPFYVHLCDVVGVLNEFDYSAQTYPAIHAAAWLHDALEDTAIIYEDIKATLGPEVALLVEKVTDEFGSNRTERKHKTYPKIKSDPDAIILKLADRIANARRSIQTQTAKPKFVVEYCNEYPEFREMLYLPGHAVRMWACLDRLMQEIGWVSTQEEKTE